MKKFDFTELNEALTFAFNNNWKLSVLVDNPLPEKYGKGKESYVGNLLRVGKDFIVLNLFDNYRLNKIVIRKDIILSVWLYKH